MRGRSSSRSRLSMSSRRSHCARTAATAMLQTTRSRTMSSSSAWACAVRPSTNRPICRSLKHIEAVISEYLERVQQRPPLMPRRQRLNGMIRAARARSPPSSRNGRRWTCSILRASPHGRRRCLMSCRTLSRTYRRSLSTMRATLGDAAGGARGPGARQ